MWPNPQETVGIYLFLVNNESPERCATFVQNKQ